MRKTAASLLGPTTRSATRIPCCSTIQPLKKSHPPNRRKTPMIKAFSQRLLPPYSGQAQIAESDRARAITMDGETWEFHFVRGTSGGHPSSGSTPMRSFRRVAYIRQNELKNITGNDSEEPSGADERIRELAEFLTVASLPFTAADRYEYWLLDPKDAHKSLRSELW